MGKRGHLPPPLLWKCKVFCALVVTAKRSVDELFMHYFHDMSSAGFRWETFFPTPPLIYPHLEKILRAAMVQSPYATSYQRIMPTSYLAPFTGYRGVLANFSLPTTAYLSKAFIYSATDFISYRLSVSLQRLVTCRLSKLVVGTDLYYFCRLYCRISLKMMKLSWIGSSRRQWPMTLLR